MDGILSQEEIDALMSAVSAGDLPVSPGDPGQEHASVSSYDFRRPYRMSKEQLRALTLIHENFARQMANALSGYLRCMVEVSLVSVSGVTFAEYQQSLPSPTGLTLVSLRPIEARAILEINQSLLLAMIDRLFGGPGLLGDEQKGLTTLEKTVIQKIVRRMLPDLADAWKGVISIQPEIDGFETNPQFASIASPADMMLYISFEIQLPKASGFASLCLPQREVDKALQVSGSAGSTGQHSRKPTPIQSGLWREGIEPTLLDVAGILGHSAITVRELLDLRVGDVIRLDTNPGSALPVMIKGEPKATARLGRVGKYRALELTSLSE